MTEQNRPDQPDAGQPRPDQPRPDQPAGAPQGDARPGRPLEDADGQPRYGVRLTPEQLAERQAQQSQQTQQSAPGGATGPAGKPGQASQPASSPYGQAPSGQPDQAPYGGSPYGQSPYGQSPYGQPGQAGQAYGHPAAAQQAMGPVHKPKEIDVSYWLILAAGVVFLAMNLFTLSLPNMGVPESMLQMLQDQYDEMGVQVEITALLEATRPVAIALTVVAAILYWVIATGIRRGSNVARIFGTIFAALSLPSLFGISFVYAGLGIAGIVFAFLRPSNEYFRGKAWEKALRR
ncbi:MAG TPA: hypothetical protein VIG75_10655 [Citricoccus sp.]